MDLSRFGDVGENVVSGIQMRGIDNIMASHSLAALTEDSGASVSQGNEASSLSQPVNMSQVPTSGGNEGVVSGLGSGLGLGGEFKWMSAGVGMVSLTGIGAFTVSEQNFESALGRNQGISNADFDQMAGIITLKPPTLVPEPSFFGVIFCCGLYFFSKRFRRVGQRNQ
ncbi:MAG: hypothetical protein ACK5LK_03180 [Chthoniobacterales bacterium]